MHLVFFLMGLAYAEPDFVTIEAGEVAPISGKILTSEALAEIITTNERDVEQCKIDAEFSLKKYKAEQDLKYNLLETRTQAEINMYQTMIQARDAQIKRDKKKDLLQKWAVYGAFVLGVGTTVGVTHAVNSSSSFR